MFLKFLLTVFHISATSLIAANGTSDYELTIQPPHLCSQCAQPALSQEFHNTLAFSKQPLKVQAAHLLLYSYQAGIFLLLAQQSRTDRHWKNIQKALGSLYLNELELLHELSHITYERFYRRLCPDSLKNAPVYSEHNLRPDFFEFLTKHATHHSVSLCVNIRNAQRIIPLWRPRTSILGNINSLCICLYTIDAVSAQPIIHSAPATSAQVDPESIPEASTPATLASLFSAIVTPPPHSGTHYTLVEVPLTTNSPLNFFIIKEGEPCSLPRCFADMPDRIRNLRSVLQKDWSLSSQNSHCFRKQIDADAPFTTPIKTTSFFETPHTNLMHQEPSASLPPFPSQAVVTTTLPQTISAKESQSLQPGEFWI